MTPLDSLEAKLNKIQSLIDSAIQQRIEALDLIAVDPKGAPDIVKTRKSKKALALANSKNLQFLGQCKASLERKILTLKKGTSTDD